MKPQQSTFLSLAVSALLLGSASIGSAAVIVWGNATNISGISDISTTGTFVQAINVGGSSTTIDTVNFLGVGEWASGITTAGTGPGSLSFSSDVTGGVYFPPSGAPAAPYTGLGPVYQSLLSSGAFKPGGSDITVTIGSLTDGQEYQVQFWLNDSRDLGSPAGTRTFTAGNSVGLDPNTTDVDSGVGQFVLGTFTAIGTTQDVTISNFQLNGYQLRAVPEPSALALAGLGVLLLARRRSARC